MRLRLLENGGVDAKIVFGERFEDSISDRLFIFGRVKGSGMVEAFPCKLKSQLV